jgi:hypothetical protein
MREIKVTFLDKIVNLQPPAKFLATRMLNCNLKQYNFKLRHDIKIFSKEHLCRIYIMSTFSKVEPFFVDHFILSTKKLR